MAKLCAALCMSHSPYLFASPDEWEEGRRIRANHGGISDRLPIDTREENQGKHARIMRAVEILAARLTASRPDVVVIFGDDQSEQFDFSNYPAFEIFAGDEFSGFKISSKFGLPVPGGKREDRPKDAANWTSVKGHPELARWLIRGLVKKGFDVSFSLNLPRPDAGIGHAFLRPYYYLVPAYDIPAVPVFVNCCYGPQPTGRRCVQLGEAIRELIEAMPADLNVAILGSGGLWHTPMAPKADLDEAFDAEILAAMQAGEPSRMATCFDSRQPAFDPSDPNDLRLASGGTGMVLGLGAGTGEIRNWIIAAAVMAGAPGTVVDYIPVYASPIGLGFAYWSL